MDHDGTGHGFALEMLRAVTAAVPVPVIASGGAGTPGALRRRVRGGRRRRARRVRLPLRHPHHLRGEGGLRRARVPDAPMTPDDVKWDAQGLAPAIVQDARSGEVLMLAWMNRESLQQTLDDRPGHLLEPQPRRAVGERRDQRQPPARPRGAARLRSGRDPRPRRSRGSGLPHRGALLLPGLRNRCSTRPLHPARPSRHWSASFARGSKPRPRARTPRSCSPTNRCATRRWAKRRRSWSSPRWAEEGGDRPRGGRPPLPRAGAAGRARHGARGCRRGPSRSREGKRREPTPCRGRFSSFTITMASSPSST